LGLDAWKCPLSIAGFGSAALTFLLAEVSHSVIPAGRKEALDIPVINPSMLGKTTFLPFLLEISAFGLLL
jgi:hypothetical protein